MDFNAAGGKNVCKKLITILIKSLGGKQWENDIKKEIRGRKKKEKQMIFPKEKEKSIKRYLTL